jgi:HEAT repeat protein
MTTSSRYDFQGLRSTTKGLAVLFASAFLVAPLTASGTREQDSESDWQAIVRIARSSASQTARPNGALTEELALHVVKELPRVLEALCEHRAPGPADENRLPLSPALQTLFANALAKLPETEVLAALEKNLESRTDADARRARLQVLGYVGSAEQLPQVFELALQEGESEITPPLAEELRSSLAEILVRDPAAAQKQLLEGWRRLGEPLLEPLVLAIGDAGDPRGVELLTDIAIWKDDLAPVAIAQIRAVGPSPTEHVNTALLELVHRSLDSSRTDRTQTLLVVMGELSDFSSIPMLVDRLESDHGGTRMSALWALQRMTGLQMPGNVQLWRRWLEKELAWARGERETTFQRLGSRSRAEAVAAAQEIARHRYERPVLAEAVAGALESSDAEVRLAACHALAALASPAATDALELARQDLDPRVAQAAASACLAIQGTAVSAPPLAAKTPTTRK